MSNQGFDIGGGKALTVSGDKVNVSCLSLRCKQWLISINTIGENTVLAELHIGKYFEESEEERVQENPSGSVRTSVSTEREIESKDNVYRKGWLPPEFL